MSGVGTLAKVPSGKVGKWVVFALWVVAFVVLSPLASKLTSVQNNQAQQWEFQSQGGGVIKVANRAISGWCIEANAIANGSAVPLWPCSSTESNLRWVFVDYGIGFGRLESRISGSTGHCLDVPMGQTLPGLWMQVYRCNFTNAQRFFAGLLPA